MAKLTPQQFVANWSNTQLKESASYITHFDDLCELVGHAKPAHVDKTGAMFTYQKGVTKNEGGKEIGSGFADVWFKDKSAGLDVASKKRTLTNLYNENPTWLQLAHRKLDEAVLDAYGWPHDLSDEDILSKLLALNLERAKNQK